MAPWTLLAGGPRHGELAVRGLRKGSVGARVASAWLAAAASGLVTLWALAGVAQVLLVGEGAPLAGVARVVPVAFALVAVGAFGVHVVSRDGREGAFRAAAAMATLAVAAALPVTGVSAWLGPALLSARYVGAGLALALVAGVAVVAPLAGSLHVRAQGVALNVAGTRLRHPPLGRILLGADATDLVSPTPAGAGRLVGASLGALVEGWGYPALVVGDVLATVVMRARARMGGLALDRVHVDVAPGRLLEAVGAAGLRAEAQGRRVLVTVPTRVRAEVAADRTPGPARRVARAVGRALAGAPPDGRVEVRWRRVRLPAAARGRVLDVRGPPAAVRELRRAFEGDLAFVGPHAWSAEATRLERRVDGLHRDAAVAVTVEERTRLLEEAEGLARRVEGRDLLAEELEVLRAKLARVRLGLQDALLRHAGRPKTPERLLAPQPVLEADLEEEVRAGGSGSGKGLRYVPHWIVPVETRWGELEVVVNAATGRIVPAESRRLHARMVARSPRLLLDATRAPRFLEAPDPAGRVVAEVRRHLRHEAGYWGPFSLDEELVETVLVPFVPGEDGAAVNVLTGERIDGVNRLPVRQATAPSAAPAAGSMDELRKSLVE